MSAITSTQAAALGIGSDIIKQLELLEALKSLVRQLLAVVKEWGMEYLGELLEEAPELIAVLMAAMGSKAKKAASDVLEDAGNAIERATNTDWNGDGDVGGSSPE